MGASRAHDQKADFDEGPEHFVKISNSFEICSIPVTQELWNLVKDVDYRTNPAPVSRIDLPQTYVSHEDVDLFLEELTLIANDGYIYRLPTEAEWEYAAKGGHDSKMARAIMGLLESHEKSGTKPLTDEDMQSLLNHKDNKGEFDYKYMLYAGSDNAADVAWFNEDGVQTVQPVKKKSPLVIDGINIYDMSGNIWEWVSDFYKADAYYDCIKTDDYKTKGYYTADHGVTDDKFSAHVFRGGSYLFDKQDCRCTKPSYWIKSYKSADLGFRLVRTQKTKEDK